VHGKVLADLFGDAVADTLQSFVRPREADDLPQACMLGSGDRYRVTRCDIFPGLLDAQPLCQRPAGSSSKTSER
jgi:hypothetical protein